MLRLTGFFKNWEEAFLYASLHGGRLPTEWEWELAARAVPGKEELRDYATQSGRLIPSEAHYDRSSTASVDDPRYQPLENGLSHMTGNVAEWMQNRYGDYPKEAVVDPIGPLVGQYRGLRGGSWHDNDPEKLMASFRNYYTPDRGLADVGFRVVVETK